jgi:hypothetical protein
MPETDRPERGATNAKTAARPPRFPTSPVSVSNDPARGPLNLRPFSKVINYTTRRLIKRGWSPPQS